MKIGILTYHKAHNYGAILQAIATRIVLSKMGHDVYYVDYWPDYHKKMYRIFNSNQFKKLNIVGKVKYIFLVISKYLDKKKRISNFNTFLAQYIEPYCLPTSDYFDTIVIGSDQIWRKQGALSDYNKVYFGANNFNSKHQITYAASMGILPKTEKEKETLKKNLSNIERISVRESDLKQLVEELGYNADLHLDPTLLLTKDEWNNILPPNNKTGKPYLLFYNFQPEAFDYSQIENYAKDHDLEIKSIVGNVRQKQKEGELSTAGPMEFLNLIRNAQIVFTTSFHGLAFSLIFNKPFYASYTHNKSRAESLLKSLDLEQLLLAPKSILPKEYVSIDYNKVNYKITELKQSSLDYLSSL